MKRGGPITPQQAAAIHPFPTAESDGLAAPAAGVPETPGERHVQVATTLAYDPTAPDATSHVEPAIPPPTAKKKGGPLAAIGRFFKRLFAR